LLDTLLASFALQFVDFTAEIQKIMLVILKHFFMHYSNKLATE